MKVLSSTLWLPKRGNSVDEYEDAAAPDEAVNADFDQFICAIADGATETSFSRDWARLLVSGYREGRELTDLQSLWQERVSEKSLPWYAQQKAESGAFAALVGLKIESNGKWHAQAIGDSCLLHVRGKRILRTFPLTKSEQFNSTPFLLSSIPMDAAELKRNMLEVTGEWESGDMFMLMTDALACWVLKRQEAFQDALDTLFSLSTQRVIEEFAEVQRSNLATDGRPLMRNDDVTLMLVVVSG